MSEKILIVDDEPEIADLVSLYLQNENFTVYKFYSAIEALNCIGHEKLDMAILDVMMPEMNGFELCKKIREHYHYPITDIQITAVKTEEEIRISVCNHGKTIPQQRLESIFEKYFRLDDARTTNTGGAGLGLAIAKEIVTLHGGTISANSEHELTTFCVTLPIS